MAARYLRTRGRHVAVRNPGRHRRVRGSRRAATPEARVRRGLDRRARRERRQRLTVGRAFRRTAGVLAVAVAILWVSNTFLAQGFSIPSGSMASTLQVGDRVLVSKLVPGLFDVRRGDIVVFTDPGGWLDDAQGAGCECRLDAAVRSGLTSIGLLPRSDGQHIVKRVIGLPGDHVASDGLGGRVVVNGVPLDESYLEQGATPGDVAFDVVVPDGQLFVLGDNRSSSADSRSHGGTQAFVALDDVVGSAVAVYWPLGRAAALRNPAQVFEKVDASGTPSA